MRARRSIFSVIGFGVVVASCSQPSLNFTSVVSQTTSSASVSAISIPETIIQAAFICPNGMALVSGNFCPEVRQDCAEWLDPIGTPYARCKRFKETVCTSKHRVAMNFCMSREETYDEDGLPYGNQTYRSCKDSCEAEGGRLCSAKEWTFACEGEEALPYTYGYERIPNMCNIDREHDLVENKKLKDHRANISEYPGCVSPFGIHNMNGNLDEWITVPGYSQYGMRSVLKGGHWLPIRGRCRPETRGHGEQYSEITTGCRCCANLK
jgi:sulfatase modifying factor 1